VWRRHNCGFKCSAIAEKNHLLLRPRHCGVRQSAIEQTTLSDWDHHTPELRTLRLVSSDSVGKSQVLEAAPSDQVLLVVEVDSERIVITITNHAKRAVEEPVGPVIDKPDQRLAEAPALGCVPDYQ
jgi:hypothetical protein